MSTIHGIGRDFISEAEIIIRNMLSEEDIMLCNACVLSTREYKYSRPELINMLFDKFSKLIKNKNLVIIYECVDRALKYIDLYISAIDDVNEHDLVIESCALISAIFVCESYAIKLLNSTPDHIRPIIFDYMYKVLTCINFNCFGITMYLLLGCIIDLTNDDANTNTYVTSSALMYIHTVCLSDLNYACCSPSLQLAGLIMYFGYWNDKISILLNKDFKHVVACTRLIYHILRVNNDYPYLMPQPEELYNEVVEDLSDDDLSILKNITSIWTHSENIITNVVESEFLQHYDIKDKIGRGAVGNIYKAEHKVTSMTYALKMVKFTEASISHAISEIAQFKYLNGKVGLVTIHSIYNITDNKMIYILMKLYDYSLFRINSINNSVETINGILKHILPSVFQGLKNIIYSGFIHGDVKPGNIFISKNGDVAIGDYGTILRTTRKRPHICYTLPLAPIEYISGGYGVTRKTDIWALGVSIASLYEDPHTVLKQLFTGINYYDKIATSNAVGIYSRHLLNKLKDKNPQLYELVKHMVCDENERWNVSQCLKSEYFTQGIVHTVQNNPVQNNPVQSSQSKFQLRFCDH